MGLSTSKMWQEMLESTPQAGTPVQQRSHHILTVDPRSVSEDIVRTPIQVLKTPVTEVSASNFKHLDPRSPSAGVIRSPIRKTAVQKFSHSASSTLDNSRSAMFNTDGKKQKFRMRTGLGNESKANAFFPKKPKNRLKEIFIEGDAQSTSSLNYKPSQIHEQTEERELGISVDNATSTAEKENLPTS